MSSRIRTSKLDAEKNYTIPQFLDLCKLDEKIVRFVIFQIVSKRVAENFWIHPDQIRATGAEFMAAIEGVETLSDRFRLDPVLIRIPGQPPFSLSDRVLVVLTEMYRNRCT